LIRNGYVVSVDPDIGDLPSGDVLIEGSTIAAVGPDLQVCEVIDATDGIVIPASSTPTATRGRRRCATSRRTGRSSTSGAPGERCRVLH
jgi:hypothetical protein